MNVSKVSLLSLMVVPFSKASRSVTLRTGKAFLEATSWVKYSVAPDAVNDRR